MLKVYHNGSVVVRIMKFALGIVLIIASVMITAGMLIGSLTASFDSVVFAVSFLIAGALQTFGAVVPRVLSDGNSLKVRTLTSSRQFLLSEIESIEAQAGFFSRVVIHSRKGSVIAVAVPLSKASAHQVETWWRNQSQNQSK